MPASPETKGTTRRDFLRLAGLGAAALPAVDLAAVVGKTPPAAAAATPDLGGDAELRARISAADLDYARPVARSEEGMPVGNGRMGSLVWTTPAALRFQINRPDVYANNCATDSFNERHNDYCGGCAFVDIDCGGAAGAVFPAEACPQHLSAYDALQTIRGRGVTARIVAWPAQDVIAVEVDDRRPTLQPIQASLRMLRFQTKYFGTELETFEEEHIAAVQTKEHRAVSRLRTAGNRIVLTQEFREGDYGCQSAVAVGFAGRPARPEFANESEIRLTAGSGPGAVLILIASAASFDPQADVAAAALRQLEAAAARGFSGLAQDTAAWWHGFWARGGVELRSGDGTADCVGRNHAWFLYLMAATSRGEFPAKFNGMLWNTDGDLRTWGAQHWFTNLSCYAEALPAADRLDLLEPVFNLYSGMAANCATAARQQWGSAGLYIPETAWFDGLAPLPEDIAAEMRALYLRRKPWAERSVRFRKFAAVKHPHSSRWNWMESGRWTDGRWVITERGFGPYGNVTHILSSGAKIAYLYWRKYEYTLDPVWLRDRAYPMLRGAAEFYRNFPNVEKGADGRYHIHGVNSSEGVWGARDTDEDLSAMRGVFAAAIRAAEILQADAALQSAWREMLENLAPLPVSDEPDALRPAGYAGPRVWVRGRQPAVKAGGGLLPDQNSLPQWFFDLCNLESPDHATLALAHATFDAYHPRGLAPDTPVNVLSRLAAAAATLGRADAVRVLLPNQLRVLRPERAADYVYKGGGVLANGMTLREGPQALAAERLGRAAEALHLALLQSNPPAPAGAPVIRLFPAWPREWDAAFTLLARGAFRITASMRGGQIGPVEIESQAGAACRLRNPWNRAPVRLTHEGSRTEEMAGPLLEFATRRGERIRVAPA